MKIITNKIFDFLLSKLWGREHKAILWSNCVRSQVMTTGDTYFVFFKKDEEGKLKVVDGFCDIESETELKDVLEGIKKKL